MDRETRDRTSGGAALAAGLRERGVEEVVVAGADTNGLLRGKRIPLDHLAGAIRDGVRMCEVVWLMDVVEEALVHRPDGHEGYFPSERGGFGDLLLRPDTETLRIVPWQDRTALVLADFARLDGRRVPIAPRTVLAGVVERARALGFEPVCALELEFQLLRETRDSLRGKGAADLALPARHPTTYGVHGAALDEPVVGRIREAMRAYGLRLGACNPESAPGQFEVNLRHDAAVSAADHAVLFKTGVKELVAQQGLTATFMAKPHPDWAGNSCHVHVSLARDGAAAFHAPGESHGMSAVMRHFAGGVLATMAELTALSAPTVNSYKRFRPYSWAATTATWAIENRTVGLRAVCEGDATRLEQRQAGGDANPYLVTAAVLAGGLHGIEHGIEPPPLTAGDAYELAPGAVPALPASLAEATDRLAASAVARRHLGDDFVEHFVATRRHEAAAAARAVTDWEVARYLEAL
jgi:glutamine synthetase